MQGSKAIDLLMQRCGNRQDTTFRSQILNEMLLVQQTQLEQAVLFPWFLIKDTEPSSTNINWPVNTEYISLPNDFLGFDDDLGCGVWVNNTADTTSDPWVPCYRQPHAVMRTLAQNFVSLNQDTPYMFDIIGTRLYLRPFQTLAAQTVRLIYIASDPALPADDSNENLWLKYAPDLVIGMTGMQLTSMGYVPDQEIAQGFAAQVMQATNRIAAKNEAVKHMLQNYHMGD